MASKEIDDEETSYIDRMYEYDCCYTESFKWCDAKDGSFSTGSAAEGAFICRNLWENKPNIEYDVMKCFGKISDEKSKDIIVPVKNFVGYYHLKWNTDLISCLDPKVSDSLTKHGNKNEYLDSQILHVYSKIQGFGEVTDGHPNIHSTIDSGIHVEIDTVPCIELSFWPDFVQPWFQRKRHWPSPEIIEEIKENKCHLVLKSTPGSNKNDEWRISFSKAEVILSKGKSPFQNKCYLLAKYVYYANLKQITDEITGRHLSSYVLKTEMLHFLEATCPKRWKYWEKNESYCTVIVLIFNRLADDLFRGYLSSFFVNEVNLLQGFSNSFLRQMVIKVKELTKFLNNPRCVKCFHSKIKSMYCNDNKEVNEEEKQDIKPTLEGMLDESQESNTQPVEQKKVNGDQKVDNLHPSIQQLTNMNIGDLQQSLNKEELTFSSSTNPENLDITKLSKEDSYDETVKTTGETYTHAHTFITNKIAGQENAWRKKRALSSIDHCLSHNHRPQRSISGRLRFSTSARVTYGTSQKP